MIVSLIKGTKIINLTLPNEVKGYYYISDYDNNSFEQKLLDVVAEDGQWKMLSNDDVSIINNHNENDSIILEEYCFYLLKIKANDSLLLLYVSPTYDNTFKRYHIELNTTINIGKSNDNDICLDSYGIDEIHANIYQSEGNYYIKDNETKLGTYVNNIRINGKKKLYSGDIIFISGLKVIFLIENNYLVLIINNPNNLVSVNKGLFKLDIVDMAEPNYLCISDEEKSLNYTELYNDYFNRKQRTVNTFLDREINIEKFNKHDGKNFIYFTILLLIIIFLIVSLIFSNKILLINVLIILLSLLLISIKIISVIRINCSYHKYLLQKVKEIDTYLLNERKNYLVNNKTLEQCQNIILDRKNIWERNIYDNDFLNICLGFGRVKSNIQINNNLDVGSKDGKIINYFNETKYIDKCPVSINLINNYILGIVGNRLLNKKYIDRMILQLITYYNYKDLKIVILTNKNNEISWEYIKVLPHIWNEKKSLRYFGTTIDEVSEICIKLDEIYNMKHHSNYLIITDNYKLVKDYKIINEIVNSKENNGFELIVLDEQIDNLPSNCKDIITLNENVSILLKDNIEFAIDLYTPINISECSKIVSNISMKTNNIYYDLLELFGVDNIEQLNCINRWKNNNNLDTYIGKTKYDERVRLDIRNQGIGEVVGTTAHHRSNFLINYIMSMCIDHSPNFVNFLIIDILNGELTKTFKGKNVAHIVGHLYEYNELFLDRVLKALEYEINRREKKYSEGQNLSCLIIVIDNYDIIKMDNENFITKLNNLIMEGIKYNIHVIYSTNDSMINSDFTINILPDGEFNYNGLVAYTPKYHSIYVSGYNKRNKLDTTIKFINNIGKEYLKKDYYKADYLDNSLIDEIIKHINRIKKEEKINVEPLWLKQLNNNIFLECLVDKYKNNYPIVGEYDDIINRKQGILSYNLNNNLLIVNKDNYILDSIMCSSIILFDREYINYYILDFHGDLQKYNICSFVGNVLDGNNKYRVEAFLRFISKKIQERKDLDLSNLPYISFIISSFDLYKERYPEYLELLCKLLKVCNMFKISILLLGNDIENVKSYFKDIYYMESSNIGKYNTCEFEVPQVNFNSLLNIVKTKDSIESIHLLPDKITYKDIKNKDNKIIIGYDIKNIQNVSYEFTNKLNVISGLNIESLNNFVSPLIKQFSLITKGNLVVIDTNINSVVKSAFNFILINNHYIENYHIIQKLINSNDKVIIFICGFKKYIEKVGYALFKQLLDNDNINIIIIDTMDNIKTNSISENGIWVGSGISEQNIFKINIVNKELSENIPENFCYVIKDGVPVLTQYVENYNVSK